ncbi:glycosyltransferase family 4 protein [Brachybacterium nesterenkovii]|uniref:glycosyltransferase family 4 protein n=1 Tax=Brachybacterium nesterenkovii TaxID=47847 RepID=UPI003219F01F
MSRIAIAANNGDIGGGEVMLLNIADSLREIGHEVLVLGPSRPDGIVREAVARDFETVALRASGRPDYMSSLWWWRVRYSKMPLWCNGLVPVAATAGLGPRLAHLHIIPAGARRSAARLGALGADEVLVPSRFMAGAIAGSRVLENWTLDIEMVPRRDRSASDPVRVGFLGRLSLDKGIGVLIDALERVRKEMAQDVVLVVGGESRFVPERERSQVEGMLSRAGTDVERRGWVDRTDFFSGIDLAVFPSIWPEPFGLVAAEAMACGVPFVVSDAGALPEVVGDEHPWIARAGDVGSLASTIVEALRASDADRAAHRAYGRARWSRSYSPPAGTERVSRLLASLHARRKG